MKTVLIIGLGLIGGSIARKLSSVGYKISFYDPYVDINELPSSFHNFDKSTKYNYIIVCTPLDKYKNAAELINTLEHEPDLITDVGSVKEAIIPKFISSLKSTLHSKFYSAHPIAGSEKTGFKNSQENLFDNKMLITEIIFPSVYKNDIALVQLWRDIGCHPIKMMTFSEHDEYVALRSHIPQLYSFIITDGIIHMKPNFRLAHSSKELWYPIFQANKAYIRKFIKDFHELIKLEENFAKAFNSLLLQNNIELDNKNQVENDSFLGLKDFVNEINNSNYFSMYGSYSTGIIEALKYRYITLNLI